MNVICRVMRAFHSVLIVGGGPVGITLAMDLAWRGIDVTVAERARAGEPPSVKCNHVAARTMEIFRRLGMAQTVRDAGLPADYPNDIAFRTTATGIEFARITIPCRADRYTARRAGHAGGRRRSRRIGSTRFISSRCWLAYAAAMPRRSLAQPTGWRGFTQSADRRRRDGAMISTSGDAIEIIHATIMVGCDGGHLPDPAADRRAPDRRRDGGAHAIHLYSRAVAARGGCRRRRRGRRSH